MTKHIYTPVTVHRISLQNLVLTCPSSSNPTSIVMPVDLPTTVCDTMPPQYTYYYYRTTTGGRVNALQKCRVSYASQQMSDMDSITDLPWTKAQGLKHYWYSWKGWEFWDQTSLPYTWRTKQLDRANHRWRIEDSKIVWVGGDDNRKHPGTKKVNHACNVTVRHEKTTEVTCCPSDHARSLAPIPRSCNQHRATIYTKIKGLRSK